MQIAHTFPRPDRAAVAPLPSANPRQVLTLQKFIDAARMRGLASVLATTPKRKAA